MAIADGAAPYRKAQQRHAPAQLTATTPGVGHSVGDSHAGGLIEGTCQVAVQPGVGDTCLLLTLTPELMPWPAAGTDGCVDQGCVGQSAAGTAAGQRWGHN